MWSRVVLALWAWAFTAAAVLIALLIPKGWAHDLWLVLPMVSGLFAMIMSFLGFAEVTSELIGRVTDPGPSPMPLQRPGAHKPVRRRAA